MNVWPTSRGRCRIVRQVDGGFTLVEVLIAIVLSGMIMGAVVAGLVTSLSVARSTTEQVGDSSDAGVISAFLIRDAQSAGATDPMTVLRDPTLGVTTNASATPLADCTPPPSFVLRFGWIDRTVPVSLTQPGRRVVAYYTLNSSTAQLTRRVCQNGTSTDVVLGSHIKTATATFDATSVSLTLSGLGTRAPLAYTLKATLRGDTQATPTVTNSTSVPLLALGAGTSVACPNLTLSPGTGPITLRGNGLIDGSCGATPISGDQSVLLPSGATSSIPGLVDPFAGRQPPADTCSAGGTNPPVGQSATRDTVTVYPQPVSITTGTVLFQPGRYVFCQGLAISGGQITGTDVMFYIKAGTMTISAAATVDLTGRTRGVDANLVIWVAAPSQTIQIHGGSRVSSLRGVIYAPFSTLELLSAKAANIGGIVVMKITIAGVGAARIGLPLPIITISPPSGPLPAGLVGVPYSATLTAAGGTAPYTWPAPTGLPAGLSINSSTGVISGTPTTAVVAAPVVVTVFDATAQAASTDYTLTVTNPAPVADADSYTTAEDTALSVAATGVLANDTDARSLPLTATVVTNPAYGTLALNTNGAFTYTPNLNFNGTDSFTYRANNGSFDSNVATVSLTVTAVNDAPVNGVPGNQETPKDANLVFSAANRNVISVSDVDAGAAIVQVTLTATSGTITLPVLTDLTLSAGDGTADPTMTFKGTIANINLRLEGMIFSPTGGFGGAATLTISTSDRGNVGSGGPLTDTDAIGIYVNPLGIFTDHDDVGRPGKKGESTYSASVYSITDGKGGIGGTADGFQFLYRSLTGDGRLTARVVSVTGNGDATDQAGVMFRETLDAGSSHGTMAITRSGGWEFLDRQGTGTATNTLKEAGPAAPYWVRLTRVGDLVTAERSVDGVTWVGSAAKPITMAPTIYIGLVVSASNNSSKLVATFDNVTITAP